MNLRITIVIPAYNEEKLISRTLQSIFDLEKRRGTKVVIVDNNSTDRTKEIAEEFAKKHSDLSLTIIKETQKGTGAACDTGFRYSIEQGAEIIARTDADAVVPTDWLRRIAERFEQKPNLQLLGGVSKPLKDEYYRPTDKALLPINLKIGRLLMAIQDKDLGVRKMAIGHNMATRADAYIKVGGFPRTKLDKVDEDRVYSRRIAAKYGWQNVVYDPKLVVYTSTRRFRKYGLVKSYRYYVGKTYREKKLKDNVDVR